jgi:2-dehydropantoate 2-reductase
LAQALDIHLSDNGMLPAAGLCMGSEEEAVVVVTKAGRDLRERTPDHRMSSLQDLDAGRPLEIHETLGYALQKAASCGVSMPVLDAFYRLIATAEKVRVSGTKG